MGQATSQHRSASAIASRMAGSLVGKAYRLEARARANLAAIADAKGSRFYIMGKMLSPEPLPGLLAQRGKSLAEKAEAHRKTGNLRLSYRASLTAAHCFASAFSARKCLSSSAIGLATGASRQFELASSDLNSRYRKTLGGNFPHPRYASRILLSAKWNAQAAELQYHGENYEKAFEQFQLAAAKCSLASKAYRDATRVFDSNEASALADSYRAKVPQMLEADAKGAESAAKAYFEDEKHQFACLKYLEAADKFLFAKAFYLRLGKTDEASAVFGQASGCKNKAKQADEEHFRTFQVDPYGDSAYSQQEP